MGRNSKSTKTQVNRTNMVTGGALAKTPRRRLSQRQQKAFARVLNQPNKTTLKNIAKRTATARRAATLRGGR